MLLFVDFFIFGRGNHFKRFQRVTFHGYYPDYSNEYTPVLYRTHIAVVSGNVAWNSIKLRCPVQMKL